MKIAINLKDQEKILGGGNNFIKSLKKHLLINKCSFTHSLKDKNIDIILILDPRKRHQLRAFTITQIIFYILFVNKNALTVQRINECDERKGTLLINKLLKLTNSFCDYTIFIATWLKELDLWVKKSAEYFSYPPEKIICGIG